VPAAEGKKGAKEGSAFSALRGVSAEEAQTQALAWLKSVGKTDAATKARFDAIWKTDAPVAERVAPTLALGSPEAATVLDQARNPDAAAPTVVPAILKDKKQPSFLRANLALAYGRLLATRKVYEEGLEALSLVKPEDVADPGSFFFHKAVCEHALMMKDQA